MRQVTGILELSKSRSKVYIEGEFAFVLYKGELRLLHIKAGEEISEEAYRKIMCEVLPKRAKLRCMNLLKSREYTQLQLERKLEQGFYPKEIIEEAIAYVKSYRYLDDERYAEQYINCRLQYDSRQKIKQNLIKRGISKNIIEKYLDLAGQEEGAPKESELIARLIEKRRYRPEEATVQEKQKMFAYLYRKGFSAEEIRRALKAEEF